MNPFRSVRVRLTLWNVGVVALSLLLFGLVLRLGVERMLMGGLDRDLRERARPIAEGWDDGKRRHSGAVPFINGPPQGRQPNLPAPGVPPEPDPRGGGGPNRFPRNDGQPRTARGVGGPPGPERRVGRFARRRFTAPPRVLNLEGRDLWTGLEEAAWSRRGFEDALRGKPGYVVTRVDGEPLRVYSHPLFRDGRLVGVVQVAAPLGAMQQALGGLTRTMLVLLPAALLFAGLGGAFLTERALRPVRALTDAARDIGANNLGDRLPASGGDEFARLAEMLNGMLGRIESAFVRQKRFTADASHELKTPLSIIKVSSSMALDEETLTTEEYRQTLRVIDRATDRANRVVQDLLLLARSESGNLPLHMVTLAVPDAVREAAASLPPGGAVIETGAVPPDLAVRADRHHVVRLLTNLLENARRHTPDDGRITVGARADGAFVEITVADTGEGIAPEHLPHVLEPFYRADEARSRDRGGTGLGLAICRTIAEAHGGTLRVESAVGAGTTVYIHLPAVN